MNDEDENNFFKRLKNKLGLATKPEDLKELPDDIRAFFQEAENYRDALFELYKDMMRLLNGHPDYDPSVTKEVFYAPNESPGEKFCLAVYPLKDSLWDITFALYCMRLGTELNEMEKLLQRDARRQLYHMRLFLFVTFPEFEKSRSEILKAKAKMDKNKAKGTEEYNLLVQQAAEFVTKTLPTSKKEHVRCVLYFFRCLRMFHLAMSARYSGMSTIQVPRPM